MLLWLSDTLGTAAHSVKLLTVSLRSTVFRNVGWLGWVNKYGPMSISGMRWVGLHCACYTQVHDNSSYQVIALNPSFLFRTRNSKRFMRTGGGRTLLPLLTLSRRPNFDKPNGGMDSWTAWWSKLAAVCSCSRHATTIARHQTGACDVIRPMADCVEQRHKWSLVMNSSSYQVMLSSDVWISKLRLLLLLLLLHHHRC